MSKQPVLVGLIDTGVDINHPDLQNSIWNNPRVGKYGYDGDYHGWNFVDNNGEVFDSANSIFDAHGTHVAGIIAAKTRNRSGVTGAAPNVKIVVLKFIGPDGYGLLSNAIAAIDYASKVGVKVINASWGGLFPLSSDDPAYDPSLQPLGDAIQASGILFVAASGNTYDGPAVNLDTLPNQGYQFYPAGFRLPNVVTVAAVNNRGNLCTLDTDGFNANLTTAPAAIVSTLLLKVPACGSASGGVGSNSAMMSRRPPKAPKLMPPPTYLPSVVMSGRDAELLLQAAGRQARGHHLVEDQAMPRRSASPRRAAS